MYIYLFSQAESQAMAVLSYAQEMEVSVPGEWEGLDPVPISWYLVYSYIASVYRFSSSSPFVEEMETILIEMQA